MVPISAAVVVLSLRWQANFSKWGDKQNFELLTFAARRNLTKLRSKNRQKHRGDHKAGSPSFCSVMDKCARRARPCRRSSDTT